MLVPAFPQAWPSARGRREGRAKERRLTGNSGSRAECPDRDHRNPIVAYRHATGLEVDAIVELADSGEIVPSPPPGRSM